MRVLTVTFLWHKGQFNASWFFVGVGDLVAAFGELRSSPFLPFEKIETQKGLKKVKIINDGETHLVIGPTIYFFCLSLQIIYPIYFVK